MGRDGFVCSHCGQKMQWQPGLDHTCGDDCRKEREKEFAELKLKLSDLGFVPHEEAPNLWIKDYVAISLEQVYNEGLEAALAAHAIAVEEHSQRSRA